MAHMILESYIALCFHFLKGQPEKILVILKTLFPEMPVRPVKFFSLLLLHRLVDESVLHSDLGKIVRRDPVRNKR